MSMYSHNGRRGEISLCCEDEDIAIDVAEYPGTRGRKEPLVAEMFINYKAVPGLIAALERMRDTIEEKVRTRAEKAADALARAGVNPRDPAEVTALNVKRDPALMESVALFYLQEAADLRKPDLPF